MNFNELEKLMSSHGVTTLAEMARMLNTTPQAVSNWKARNQVPHHIVTKLSQLPPIGNTQDSDSPSISYSSSPITQYPPLSHKEDTISLSDILLTIAEQIKVIVLTTFISIFLTFTYVKFIQAPEYESWATVLLPENKSNNLGGLAGLASQFGVNIPTGGQADLSSPSLFPELLKSRTFAEQILNKQFYTDKFGQDLTLLAILTHGVGPPEFGRDTLITEALASLGTILEFNQSPTSTFSVIKVKTYEPVFAKELAEVVISELESLNRYFKSLNVNETLFFINQRIESVESDLKQSEHDMKAFNEQNRQISSPALLLEQERLNRDVEIQKSIYLTLRQQLELAKIEEVQEASIVQILDKPQIPLNPSNKRLRMNVILAGFFGLGFGIILGFIRSYLKNNDIQERKKIRRVKFFIRKKTKDILFDRRVSGIISLTLILGLPFYLGYQSKIPVYFGMYSPKLMLFISIYIIFMLISVFLFFFNKKKSN